MWYYALVLCFDWNGPVCADLRIIDQDSVFDQLQDCARRAVEHRRALEARPGWAQTRMVRGVMCAPRPPGQLGPLK